MSKKKIGGGGGVCWMLYTISRSVRKTPFDELETVQTKWRKKRKKESKREMGRQGESALQTKNEINTRGKGKKWGGLWARMSEAEKPA